MNRGLLLLIIMVFGLAAKADYTVTTVQPLPQQYQAYQPYYQPLVPSQPVNYSTVQPYGQTYNQGYYQDPYQAQYHSQCYNPYQYQQPYVYGNNLPYSTVNSTTSATSTTGGNSILKNIGQSVLYSMLRGY